MFVFLRFVSDTVHCGIGGGGGGAGGANTGITGGGTLPRRTTVGFNGKSQSSLGTGAGFGGGAHLISPGGTSGGPGGGTTIGGTLTHHLHGGGTRPDGTNSGKGGTTSGTGLAAKTVKLDDLIHLPGPLTEDAVMRTLQTRFNEGKFFVSTSSSWGYCFVFIALDYYLRYKPAGLTPVCII